VLDKSRSGDFIVSLHNCSKMVWFLVFIAFISFSYCIELFLIDISEAVNCLSKAIEIYTDMVILFFVCSVFELNIKKININFFLGNHITDDCLVNKLNCICVVCNKHCDVYFSTFTVTLKFVHAFHEID